jgi:hypothetical protein
MAYIKIRKQSDGSTRYTAIVRLRRGKTIIHQEARTFAHRVAAVTWDKHREVVLEDPVSRDPKSWKLVSDVGVPQAKIDEYVRLLAKLDANETLAGVYGLGKASLIAADITYGLFDNGIIKGCVLLPSDPRPVVADLDNWPPEAANATTAFKALSDNWYLFELHH